MKGYQCILNLLSHHAQLKKERLATLLQRAPRAVSTDLEKMLQVGWVERVAYGVWRVTAAGRSALHQNIELQAERRRLGKVERLRSLKNQDERPFYLEMFEYVASCPDATCSIEGLAAHFVERAYTAVASTAYQLSYRRWLKLVDRGVLAVTEQGRLGFAGQVALYESSGAERVRHKNHKPHYLAVLETLTASPKSLSEVHQPWLHRMNLKATQSVLQRMSHARWVKFSYGEGWSITPDGQAALRGEVVLEQAIAEHSEVKKPRLPTYLSALQLLSLDSFKQTLQLAELMGLEDAVVKKRLKAASREGYCDYSRERNAYRLTAGGLELLAKHQLALYKPQGRVLEVAGRRLRVHAHLNQVAAGFLYGSAA